MRTRRALPAALVATTVALSGAAAAHGATPPPNLPYGATWTVDTAANALYEYGPGASGTDAPIATISGADTGLNAPSALALDSQGRVFVANAGNDSITEYAANASTDAHPLATISGANTLLNDPSSITVNGGEIWVTNPDSNLVESFAVGSDGDEFPATTIGGAKTQLDHPVGVAVGLDLLTGDSDVTVINSPVAGAGSITQYSTLKPGDVKPLGVVTKIGSKPVGSLSSIYSPDGFIFFVTDAATNSAETVAIFQGEAEGNHKITGLDDPTGVSVNAVADLVIANAGDHSVRVFAPNAKGAATPLSTLTGVGNDAGSPAAAVVLGAKPGSPTGVKVDIHKTTAHVSWQPPTVTGGGILAYEVIAIREDAKDPLAALLGIGGGTRMGITKKTSITLNKLKPGHRYLFEVAAVNAFGGSVGRPVSAAYVLPPSAPTHVQAFGAPHSALVKWKAPKQTGGANIRTYTVDYAAGCTPGAKGCKTHHTTVPAPKGAIVGLGNKSAGPTATIKGLQSKTKYEIVVTARNSAGLGAPSRVKKVTTS